MKVQRGGGGGVSVRMRVKIVFRALQSVPCLPGRLCVVHGVCVCVWAELEACSGCVLC